MNQYKFRTPGLFKGITAEEAAAELERIRERRGYLSPESVVDESRDPGAVLHKCFQWDDLKAAEMYRIEQARDLIGNIVVIVENNEVSCKVRAFVNVRPNESYSRSYMPITEALVNDAARKDLLSQAKAEMESFVAKYSQLEELNRVKEAMLFAINGINPDEQRPLPRKRNFNART